MEHAFLHVSDASDRPRPAAAVLKIILFRESAARSVRLAPIFPTTPQPRHVCPAMEAVRLARVLLLSVPRVQSTISFLRIPLVWLAEPTSTA